MLPPCQALQYDGYGAKAACFDHMRHCSRIWQWDSDSSDASHLICNMLHNKSLCAESFQEEAHRLNAVTQAMTNACLLRP